MKNRTKSFRKKGETMDLLLDFIIDVLAKRPISDKAGVKVEQIHNKVALVPIPEGILDEDFEEEKSIPNEDGSTPRKEKQMRKANTKHNSIIYIQIPQTEEPVEVPIDVTNKDGNQEQEVQMVMKMVDEDQQGKALAVNGTHIPNLKDQIIYNFNQYAMKTYRENFLETIKDKYPEYFEDNLDFEDILEAANETAEKDIAAFEEANCHKYVQPCLKFELNAKEI